MSAVGLNIHALFSTARELDQAVDYHRVTKPGASVSMDNRDFAERLARESPDTLVIHRRSGDNNCHLVSSPFYVSPEQWAANYLADIPRPIPANIAFYYNNEPGVSRDLNDHALAVAKQVAPYPDVKVVFLNLSVGVPNAGDWNLMEPFFRYITQPQFRGRFFLGLHCYGLPDLLHDWGYGPDFRTWPTTLPGVGNLLGRWRAFDNWCASKGITPPEIVITEYGYDIISAYSQYQQSLIHTPGFKMVGMPHANVAQWVAWINQHGLGMTWQQYAAESLYRGHRLFYNTPRIRGVCLFCHGGEDGYDQNGDPKWRRGFDYSQSSMPQFLPYLQSKDWSMATQPPPNPAQWMKSVTWNTAMNLRPVASTGVQPIAVIPPDTAVTVINPKVTINAYAWVKVRYGTKEGWVALGTVTP